MDTKGVLSAETDEERIGKLYTYNLLGWLTQKREPVALEGRSAKYRVTCYVYDRQGI